MRFLEFRSSRLRTRSSGAALALGVAMFGIVPPLAARLPHAPFPLGRKDLAEARVDEAIAPGLVYHHIMRGAPDPKARWTISAGIARTAEERSKAIGCLKQAGLLPRHNAYHSPGTRPQSYAEFLGGSFASELAAQAAITASPAAPCNLVVRHMASTAQDRDGPWLLHIIEIDPRRFQGRLFSALSQDKIAGRERTSVIASQHDALAAINGGFFALTEAEGVAGEPAGIAVLDDRIQSEPTQGRPYLVLRDGPRVAAEIVTSPPAAGLMARWEDGSTSSIDGINRKPGMIRNCGAANSSSAPLPAHDITCAQADALIVISDQAGFAAGPSDQAVLVASDGTIRPATGAETPATGEFLLIGTGHRATELAQKAETNRRVRINLSYRAIDRAAKPHASHALYAVNGAPLLLSHGRAVRREDREGWPMDLTVDRTQATHAHDWLARRNPRTAAGIGREGTIYLLVADGRLFPGSNPRQPVHSVGLTIEELRAVMQHLGARDAINLDGGGSSTLVLRGVIRNQPSDSDGERAIGDAILITR